MIIAAYTSGRQLARGNLLVAAAEEKLAEVLGGRGGQRSDSKFAKAYKPRRKYNKYSL
jgi:hypothetical protein